MTGVWADGNVSAVKGVTIHNHHGKQIQQNGVKDGVNGGRHMLCEEQKSKFNEVSDDKNGAHRGLVHVQAVLHTQQQQSQPCTVRWERFLPIRSIKVLLVENDECTRHVVSALLRNCSYEVTAVANGVDAWKVLDDLTNHIDLILTEVTMPYLSGIGLLSKVMNHKTHKSVPVIMMSSNDSMGIVFKCLSKGAVDFLVKPIRKNELKNLWQHVWRKCHSSGGSGSESGIRIQKSTKAKHIEGVEDSSDGNDENASDNGSGTQGSWSKRAIEVESPQAMLQWDELAKPLDSTCAQAIHSRPEAQSSNWVPTNSAREYQGNASMGKDLQIGVASTPDLQINAEEVSKDEETLIGKLEELNTAQKSELRGEDTANGVLTKETGTYNNTTTKEMPSLELSLMQHREVGDSGTMVQERNILRHSGQSAFLRYGGGTTATTSANNQAPTGNVGSCSNVDNNNYSNNNNYNNNNYNTNNSSEVAKTGSMHNSSSIPNHQSNGSSNNIHDVGSSTNKIPVKPPETKIPFGKVDSVAQAALVQSRVMMQQQQVQVQHHHHHYHHHHHHMHNQQQQQQNDSLPVRGNGEGNYTSASGSNNGSNGQDESNAGVIGEETANDNMDTEDEMEAIWKAGGGESGSGNRSGVVDQSPQALREAALNKFRQKRKERNFGKKVRYQSRKRLAEQRPRVRGQFVSLSSSPDNNNSNKDKASDSNS